MKLVPALLAMMGVLLAMSCVTLHYYDADHPDSRPGAADITVHPVVVKSSTDYLDKGIYGVGNDVQEIFASEYTTDHYSKALRSAMISDMVHQADELGLDGEGLRRCINATGIFQDKWRAILPCYAEYAFCNGTRCWEITMAWEYFHRAHPVDMGHIRNYLVDARTCEVLKFETCD